MPAPWRTYLVFTPPSYDVGAPTIVLTTRSGAAAIAEAERVGGWVEGDDICTIWPTAPHDGGRAYDWAMLRRWAR